MPRLTKQQAIEFYGRNLPTPTIEKMTINTVHKDDAIYTALNFKDVYEERERTAPRVPPGPPGSPPYEPPVEDLDVIPAGAGFRYLTRIDIDLSFYMSTWEGFDPQGLTEELFSKIQEEYGNGESLYLSLLSETNIPPNLPTKVDLAKTFNLYADAGRNVYENDNQAGANEYWTTIGQAATGTNEYVIAMPISDFYSVADITAEYDMDNNVVLKISNISIPIYISNFNELRDLKIYAACTSGHPFSIASNDRLDARTFSLNFSDFTYEDILKNGSMATFGVGKIIC